MNFIDLNGQTHKIAVNSKQSHKPTFLSKLHQLTSEYLNRRYPYDTILQEFIIPGTQLRLDFFIPRRRLAIEVQGTQHNEHTAFFHGGLTENKFMKQTMRDVVKHQWCDLNDIRMIEINNESDLNELSN